MKKVLLVIFDGFGEAPAGPGNAITLAKTPYLAVLRSKHPFGLLQAAGEAVGLTGGTMGGSEVGHFTMGAGRIVPQFLLSINKDIQSGEFFKKQPLIDAFAHAKKTGGKLHLLGMISDKGVHSHLSHLFALLEWAAKEKLKNVYVHCIADGRDVEERSVKNYLQQLQNKMTELGVGKIATIVGRYYTMDRDTNWDRTEKAYRLMTAGEGQRFDDPLAAIEHCYAADLKLTDYYLPPLLITSEGLVETNDAVIFFNYRTDRTQQITSAFVDSDFTHFQRIIGKINFVCMGPYSKTAPVVYSMPTVKNNLADWLAHNHITQLRVAETEKYAHVTYFFNSQVERAKPLEDRILINSPKVPSYAQKPEMSAPEVTDKVLYALQEGKHQVLIVNYANADLVGHSADLKATIHAIEVLDECIGKLYDEAIKTGTTLLLTGDHGNAEEMLFADGSPRPSHTTNPVIFLVADPAGKIIHVKNGGLQDVAPTILKLLDLPKPKEMTGKPLI
ncbi:MAG: 2,3-bisphosphoglycerate-independent phosphoglycerate mutase [Candidatus Peregrinibacteria bacterium]